MAIGMMRINRLLCSMMWTANLAALSVSVVSGQQVDGPSSEIDGHALLGRLGAKLERGVTDEVRKVYTRHFDISDTNRDGKHSWEEFVTHGLYLTPQARAGIFRAADDDGDQLVTKAEYIRNRIITDEAKAIIQGMDENRDGWVVRAEFLEHASRILSDRRLAGQVFSALDSNNDGVLFVPEYLRVWGRWARSGPKKQGERQTGVPEKGQSGRNRTKTLSPDARDRVLQTLPDISVFEDAKSPRFLIDFEDARTGHPYYGENYERPHTGGHVYFAVQDKTGAPEIPRRTAAEVDRFPPIYAVADGVISRIDFSFRLREMYEPALQRRVANYRYGIGLSFAKLDGQPVDFHYSIEPFVDPGDAEFYDPFILVKVGQRVKRGQVIARMYLPANQELAQKSHIHFNLIGGKNHRFMAPVIFTQDVARRFHSTWHRMSRRSETRIPPCFGYELAPHENPFGTGAQKAL